MVCNFSNKVTFLHVFQAITSHILTSGLGFLKDG